MSYEVSRLDQESLLRFVADETKTFGWSPDAVAFSVAPKDANGGAGAVIAVGVFEDFTAPGRMAEFSFAMIPEHRMNRGIIEAFAFIAFHPRILNLDILWAKCRIDNPVSQRALLAIGAEFQYRKPSSAADGSDVVVMRMTRNPSAWPAARASDATNREEG